MRRFVLYRLPDILDEPGPGIVAFGCEMWPNGPVALIWTIEPYYQTWLINIDGLNMHQQVRVQHSAGIEVTEIVFLDEPSDSVLDHMKGLVFGGGRTEDFPTSELQNEYESTARLRLVRVLPSTLSGVCVPQEQ